MIRHNVYNIHIYFNSIKVRLEHVILMWIFVAARFQFHKGAIRTPYPSKLRKSYVNFNSIKVRLELRPERAKALTTPEFQFHKGAIRTKFSGSTHRSVPLFQFHKGAIRTRQEIEGTGRALISIP